MRRPNWFSGLFTAVIIVQPVFCAAEEPKDQFEAPVCLKVDDQPINVKGQLMYPSPAIFDVDRDGKDELVIGTIFGQLVACENTNPSSGDPVWSEPKPIETTEGKPIELNNW